MSDHYHIAGAVGGIVCQTARYENKSDACIQFLTLVHTAGGTGAIETVLDMVDTNPVVFSTGTIDLALIKCNGRCFLSLSN